MKDIESECAQAYKALSDPRIHYRTHDARIASRKAHERWRTALAVWHAAYGARYGWRIAHVPVAVVASHIGEPVFYASAAGTCRVLLLHSYLPPVIAGLKCERIPFAAYADRDDPRILLLTGDVIAALRAAQLAADPDPPRHHHREAVIPGSLLWLTPI